MKIPIKALSNIELIKYAKILEIPHFRGVFSRDDLPKRPFKYERSIINLDGKDSTGTHWIALRKDGNTAYILDSLGNLKPPLEVLKYLEGTKVFFNYQKLQNKSEVICGHICLQFLAQP